MDSQDAHRSSGWLVNAILSQYPSSLYLASLDRVGAGNSEWREGDLKCGAASSTRL